MLPTQTIKLDKEQLHFLKRHKEYGFHSESELLRFALKLFKKKISKKNELIKSADLYAELYDKDKETQNLTEGAIYDWE